MLELFRDLNLSFDLGYISGVGPAQEKYSSYLPAGRSDLSVEQSRNSRTVTDFF